MRAVVQRVRSAEVLLGGEISSRIGPGLLAFVGVGHQDGPADVQYIATKIRDLRIFPDDHDRMNRSVVESGGAVLIVSQFTLYADARKGRRPSFDDAAPPPVAQVLYEDVIRELRAAGLSVEAGVFQARMDVRLVNDGPVTILLDSQRRF
ncbi:MAG TPA: D-aminoacyl-tRNA deacylase [Vicinamibacterales bacterium]|nr:D-aminoacyl-tRNA deacylase [Vicinamibacterales bacterium]